MGKQELVQAFIRGDIDRRQFVSRLTMLGVSGGAALAYATNLQSAAAAPVAPSNGFVKRAQADDEEYGTAIAIGTLEALQEKVDGIQQVLALLANLDQFQSDDFPASVYETLQTVRDQQQQHLEAVIALLESIGESAADGTAGGREFSSVDEFLAALSDELDELTGMYAAIVPAIDDDETRQTSMNIASVASRHAALVNLYAERNPIPEAFEEPSMPEGE
jgi:fumarate hydratase class II